MGKHVFLSIGFCPSEALKQKALRWAVSGEVKLQDFFYVFSSVSASSKAGLDMAWSFFRSEFDSIRGMVKDASSSIMDAVIQASTSGFCSEDKAMEIESFFEAHTLPQNKRTITQLLEEVRTSAKFLDRTLATDIVKSRFWED